MSISPPSTSGSVVVPLAPRTAEATGLPFDLIYQVVLKTLHYFGEATGTELAARLGVVFGVLEASLESLKHEHYCEISRGGMGSQSYLYRLTAAGHVRATAAMEFSPYVGKLPVPLAQYTEYMKRFGRHNDIVITRQAVREAFKDLVLSDQVLDQLGPGIAARHSIFIYGPPGNGKTVIAHTIVNLLGGDIAIPHALAVDTEIISLYDPLNHRQAAVAGERSTFLAAEHLNDDRWIKCRRPVVTVGGELTLDSLELGYSSRSGLYHAPLQALANGGILVIDDFGRQHVSPREMLNRWIVPLESRVDHLVLQTGQKFEIPFETLIVFATNLNPLALLDESFIRRIRHKVYAESPTHDEFVKIFENCCHERDLRFDPAIVDALIATQLQPRKVKLRGCQPRDLIDHALSLAEYAGEPKELTIELMSAACSTYFLSDDHRSAQ
jgi:predicted ATPase with chaperone activity